MQLRELSSWSSILDTQFRELESASSISATEPYRMLRCIGSSNTRKGTNALAKVQLKNTECTPAKGCNRNIANLQLIPERATSNEENGPDLPEGAKVTLQKVLCEGECEFWDVLCPGFAPNPFCLSSGFGVLLWFLFGRSGRSSPSRRWLLRCFSVRHACITRYGGRWPRQPPPPLGLLSQLSLSFLGFWEWDGVPCSAPDIMLHRSVHSPPLSSGSRENHGPNEESGEATVLSHKCANWEKDKMLSIFPALVFHA